MLSILNQACALLFIIFLGFFVRRIGLVRTSDFKVLCAVTINVTIPCAILAGTRNLEVNMASLGIMALGFFSNWIMVIASWFLQRRNTPMNKAFTLLNLPGFNIGCFAMPYVQGLLGPEAVAIACLFDSGNVVMCCGANYAIAASILSQTDRLYRRCLEFVIRIFSSVPFCVYMFTLLIRGFHIPLPSFCWHVINTIAPANVFLSLFMLGVGLSLSFESDQVKSLLYHLKWRTLITGAMAVGAMLLPFTSSTKLTIVLMILSPATVIATAFTAKIGGDSELATTYNSASTFISLILMTLTVVLWPR